MLSGTWGALIEIPETRVHPPFPATLGYVVWAVTMVPCAIVALRSGRFRFSCHRKVILYGCAVGFSKVLGQLILFRVLTQGPAYIIFPIICLSPVVTIVLSFLVLKERTHLPGSIGIFLSIIAIFLLSLQEPERGAVRGYAWLIGAISVFFM